MCRGILPEGTREKTLVTKGGEESTMIWVCGDTTVALPDERKQRGKRKTKRGGREGESRKEGFRRNYEEEKKKRGR